MARNFAIAIAFIGFSSIALLLFSTKFSAAAANSITEDENNEIVEAEPAAEAVIINNSISEATDSPSACYCDYNAAKARRKPFIFVSTLDGAVSAIDASPSSLDDQGAAGGGGNQIWTLRTDREPLLSSTLGDIPFFVKDREYRLIPSLDGHFYVYNDAVVQSAPFDLDGLLSGSLKLGADVLSGGKQVRTYLVDYYTGRILQICDASGCERFDAPGGRGNGPKLIIRRTTQTVRAIDPGSVEERWNVTVGEHELLLDDGQQDQEEGESTDQYCLCLDEDQDDLPFPPITARRSSDSTSNDQAAEQREAEEELDFKIIPPEGVLIAYDKRNPGLALWEKKFDSPIVQVWSVGRGGNSLVERSIFDRSLIPAFSYYSMAAAGGGGHSSVAAAASRYQQQDSSSSTTTTSQGADKMIYIGTYDNQKYVIRSLEERRKLKNLRGAPSEESSRVYLLAPASQLQIGGASDQSSANNNHLEGSCAEDCPTCASEEVNALILHNQYPRDMGWYLYKHKTAHIPRLESKTFSKQPSSGRRTNQQRVADFLGSLSQTQFCILVALTISSVFVPTSVVMHFYRRRLRDLWESMMAKEQQASGAASHHSHTPSTEVTSLVTPTFSHESSTDVSGRSYGRYSSDFEPVRQLGRGGFGIVVESRNRHDDQVYAVKRIAFAIKKNAKERVRREVKALAQLDHPGVVRYFSAWFEEPPADWQKEADRDMFQKCRNLAQQGDDELDLSSGAPDDRSAGDLAVIQSGGSMINDNIDNSNWIRTKSATFGTWTDNDDYDDKAAVNTNNNHKMWRRGGGSTTTTMDKDDSQRPPSVLQQAVMAAGPRLDSVEVIFSYSGASGQSAAFEGQSAAREGQSAAAAGTKENGKQRKYRQSSTTSTSTRSAESNSGSPAAGVVVVDTAYLYIQMQLCSGTLKDWLLVENNQDHRDRSNMLDWFDQLICAMEYVHDLGLVHRDLKPSNIFFSTKGVLKIGDFGLVATAASSSSPLLHPAPNIIENGDGDLQSITNGGDHQPVDGPTTSVLTTNRVGTQLYMSPEQEIGRKCTAKADIYALGLILLELLVPCKTVMQRVRMLQDARKTQFPDGFADECPREHSLIRALLSHDPSSRPACSDIRLDELFSACWTTRPVQQHSPNSQGGRTVSRDSGTHSGSTGSTNSPN